MNEGSDISGEHEAWQRLWDPVVAAIGTDLGTGAAAQAADRVEAGAIRRWTEPLEFACALHDDRKEARRHGHPDIIAPYTAMLSFALPPMWFPGAPTLFPAADRDAQPERSVVKPVFPDFFPPFTGYFATDVDMDYLRPAHVGERLQRRGAKLVACHPKETRVGRGAFVTTEAEIANEEGNLLARVRTSLFLYTPREGAR
ncbi:FAS1-like dehydratase domain-containing protein [Sphingopyxis sp.]|uniref:FAS1-like dehydratase domain-containing protein n=1 Tax=Sphingopyxis sp. TaxID=1908224 RepID=UPI003D6CD7D6